MVLVSPCTRHATPPTFKHRYNRLHTDCFAGTIVDSVTTTVKLECSASDNRLSLAILLASTLANLVTSCSDQRLVHLYHVTKDLIHVVDHSLVNGARRGSDRFATTRSQDIVRRKARANCIYAARCASPTIPRLIFDGKVSGTVAV